MKKTQKNENFLAFWHRSKMAVTWLCATFLISVHSVEDSVLMPMFDEFHFSFVFLGLPKIGPNRYT